LVSIKLMRTTNLNNTAFSLLEILLASIIFIITIGGLFATLNAVRKPVADKENALTAAIFGKQVLETLRSSVNAQSSANFYGICSGNCTTFDLQLGTHQVSQANLPTVLSWPSSLTAANGGANPVLNYTVSCGDGSPNNSCGADIARKVVLNISW